MDKTPVYSPRQIFAGSLLGGPIALVYFLRNNFQRLGKKAAAAQTLLWGVLFNIAILAAIPFLPKHFPNYVLPLSYSWVARIIADTKQLNKGSIASSTQFDFHSNWRVFGLGFVFVLGTLLLWFPFLFVLLQLHVIDLD